MALRGGSILGKARNNKFSIKFKSPYLFINRIHMGSPRYKVLSFNDFSILGIHLHISCI